MKRSASLLLALALAAACAEEPQQSAPTVTRADSISVAAMAFQPTAFDTIAWENQDAAIDRGNLVFTISCAKCHGASGRGNGGFVLEGVTLTPPDFLATDWRFADDPMGLRRQIFTGNVAGMPYWGLVGLKYRDIDAVATFINGFLRPNYGGG